MVPFIRPHDACDWSQALARNCEALAKFCAACPPTLLFGRATLRDSTIFFIFSARARAICVDEIAFSAGKLWDRAPPSFTARPAGFVKASCVPTRVKSGDRSDRTIISWFQNGSPFKTVVGEKPAAPRYSAVMELLMSF